jgi:Plavaka transposase
MTLHDVCDENMVISSEGTNSDRWWKGFNPEMDHDQDEAIPPKNLLSPLSNPTSFRILNWFYGGSKQKSQAELTSLIENVLKAEDFDHEDAAKFSFSRETALLDSIDDPTAPFSNENIWKTSMIKIPLPCERQKFSLENNAHKLRIRNVRHRSLLEVMETAAKDESSKSWHNTPFKMFWKPTPDSPPQRVVSELYNADAFLEEHKKIEKLPIHLPDDAPGPKPVENAVFAIMIWSDSTHLTNFGDASMWPIYLYCGGQSKYPCGRPSQHSAHHVAHIPLVSFWLSGNMFAHLK